jgi:phosphoribosylanthranilate isomerase
MRTRVKICGITRARDALKAVEFGADAIGLVFYEKSPRAVTIEDARAIIQKLPPFVSVVGLLTAVPITGRISRQSECGKALM